MRINKATLPDQMQTIPTLIRRKTKYEQPSGLVPLSGTKSDRLLQKFKECRESGKSSAKGKQDPFLPGLRLAPVQHLAQDK